MCYHKPMDSSSVQWKIIGACLLVSFTAFSVAIFLAHIYPDWTWGAFFHTLYGKITLGGIITLLVGILMRFLKIKNLLKHGRLLNEQIKGQQADNKQKERREQIDEMKNVMLSQYARVKSRDVNSSYIPSPEQGEDIGIFNQALAELKKEHPTKF